MTKRTKQAALPFPSPGPMRGSFGVRLRAKAEDNGEKWTCIFPRGEWHGPNLQPIGGSINLTDDVFAEMVANWKAAGSPALPIYWHHPPPPDEVPPEKREEVFRAAGWMEDFRVTEAGLEARTTWSLPAQARLDADEYRFISPEWQPRSLDRRTGKATGWTVTAAALTDSPFFNEMPRVAAAAPTHSPNEGDEPKEQHVDKKMICQWLGMPEDTGDEEVMAALKVKCTASAPSEEKLTAALKGLESAASETAKLTARVAELEAEKVKAAAAIAERDFEDVIKAGLAEGRAGLPAMREPLKAMHLASGLEHVKALIAALPKVPTQETGTSTPAPEASGDFDSMKAAYDAKLDELIKSGLKTSEATKQLRNDKAFANFFKASAVTLTNPTTRQ